MVNSGDLHLDWGAVIAYRPVPFHVAFQYRPVKLNQDGGIWSRFVCTEDEVKSYPTV